MSSSASGSGSQVPAVASSSGLGPPPRSPPPHAEIVRYVCTVSQSCRQTFSNYNNWAQHETNAHREMDAKYEVDVKPKSNEGNGNKRIKAHNKPASAQEQSAALQKSNAQQRAKALRRADALACTYDIWYCNGVDGCTDGWYARQDFETHFREKHTMGWNKVQRSSLISDYLLGPEHGIRMWCGFCNMVMEVSSKEKWYYDRITHIASHFDKECPDEIWYGDIYGWNFIKLH